MVAKFLRNNLPQLETQAVCYFLRQVRMWATAEYFDIRHFVAVKGVVQSEQAASSYRVRGIEGSKTTTGNWSTVDVQLLSSYNVFPTYPPLCPTHHACGGSSSQAARTLSLTFCRDDVILGRGAKNQGHVSEQGTFIGSLFFLVLTIHMLMQMKSAKWVNGNTYLR